MADIKTELTVDPLVRDYDGMDSEAAAADMNTAYRDDPNPPTSVPAAALWNAVDPGEYDALNVDNKALIDFIGALGSDIPIAGGLIKNKVFAIFVGGSVSRSNIIALTIPPLITRAEELRDADPDFPVPVLPRHVTAARL